jgi:8-oxo-dGTP pyrophosphatase MutT (NUDIX family)
MRECQEEVGLPLNLVAMQPISWEDAMVFESAYIVDGQVKASAVIVYLRVECEKFEAVLNKSEAEDYKWKKLEDDSDEEFYTPATKSGYPEGPLTFLSFLRGKEKPQASK